MRRAFLRGSWFPWFAVWLLACGQSHRADSASASSSNDDEDQLHGLVIDDVGSPMAGVKVRIGKSMQLTGPDGRFSVHETALPYDATLARADDGQINMFLGLTTLNPTLRLTERTASVGTHYASIHLTYPQALTDTRDAFEMVEVRGVDQDHVNSATNGDESSRYYNVTWSGDGPVTLHVTSYLYEIDPATYEPVHILSIAEYDGPPQSRIDWPIEWQPYTGGEKQVIVENNLPPSISPLYANSLFLRRSGSGVAWPPWLYSGRQSENPRFVVPAIEGLRLDAQICGYTAESIRACAMALDQPLSAGTIRPELQPLLEHPMPAAGAHASAQKLRLSWRGNGQAGSLKVFPVEYKGLTPELNVVFDGSVESVTLPDLSDFGMMWPSHTQYRWVIYGSAERSVDDLAALPYWRAPTEAMVDPRDIMLD